MRRPVFWFLWPAAEPGPVDADAVQERWLRVCGRGPWRWAFLIVASAAVVISVSAAVAATLAQPGWITIALSIVVAVPLVALLARAWVAGTYVSDRGVKVSRVLTTELVPWPRVVAIDSVTGSRWLGLPLRLGGERIVVRTTDDAGASAAIDTHVETASPDLWLRPQALDAAAGRLRTWLRETRD
jgi:hypothetical protein